MGRVVGQRRFCRLLERCSSGTVVYSSSVHTVPPTPKSRKELLRNVNEPRSSVRPTVTPKFGENTSSLAVIPTRELFRAWFVYQLFRFNYIVDRSEMLTKLSRRILGERLFNRVMRATVYGQFVGGESIPELKKVIGSLKEHGIYPVLDYAVEKDIADTEEVSLEKRQRAQDSAANGGKQGLSSPEFKSTKVKAKVIKRASARTHFYSGEQECDRNMESFLLSLKAAAECSVGTTAFVAVKLTALGRPEFLLELAEVLTRTRREFYSISSSATPSPSSSPLSPPSSPLNPLSTPTHSLSSSLQGTFGQVLTQESLQAWLQKAGVDCSAATVEELYGEMDLDGSGHVDLLDWLKFFEPGRKIHKMFKAMKDTHSVLYLSEDGQIQMANMLLRARTIAESASTLGVRMMVDAEQSYYQPGIRHIAVSVLMPDYNHTIPVVYNTIQSYLKKSPAVIEEDVALSKRWQFYYGVKLVRGAYMEQERERAEEMGYPSPIHDTKEDTDSCYNGNITRLLREAKGGRVSLMVASHNEDSASHAVREMSRLGVPAHDGTVTFGQLYGMCDHVSLTLGQSGYEVYKYLPYGPINEVMPYLIRRANENRAMMKGADKYRKLISRELRRRAKSSFTQREKLARSDTT